MAATVAVVAVAASKYVARCDIRVERADSSTFLRFGTARDQKHRNSSGQRAVARGAQGSRCSPTW